MKKVMLLCVSYISWLKLYCIAWECIYVSIKEHMFQSYYYIVKNVNNILYCIVREEIRHKKPIFRNMPHIKQAWHTRGIHISKKGIYVRKRGSQPKKRTTWEMITITNKQEKNQVIYSVYQIFIAYFGFHRHEYNIGLRFSAFWIDVL